MRFADLQNRIIRQQESFFQGEARKIRIVSEFGHTWRYLKAYEEAEERVTINDKGQVWLSKYDRAPCPYDPYQLSSREYIRIPSDATERIMNTATECFRKYKHDRIYDTPRWYADIESTEGRFFQTDGSQESEYDAGMSRLTNIIRKELNKPDLLVVGGHILNSKEEVAEEPIHSWFESISYDELIPMAKNGLNEDHDRRVDLLRALEYQYYDNGESDIKRVEMLQRLMHSYVLSLEAERPVRRNRFSFTWKELADDEE